MTPNKFIQSFESFQTGEDGYCRLASMSTEKENSANLIGFWFKIFRNGGSVTIVKVQLKSNARRLYSKIFVISEETELEEMMNYLRIKAQDHLCSILH